MNPRFLSCLSRKLNRTSSGRYKVTQNPAQLKHKTAHAWHSNLPKNRAPVRKKRKSPRESGYFAAYCVGLRSSATLFCTP